MNLIDVDEASAERYAVIFTTLREAGTPIGARRRRAAAGSEQLWLVAGPIGLPVSQLAVIDSHHPFASETAPPAR